MDIELPPDDILEVLVAYDVPLPSLESEIKLTLGEVDFQSALSTSDG